ncbi:MAG: DUF1579 family protein [Phycisphaerales bacterium]|nr:DUF1579 family protein [Phycisphaerales bacterium]
MRWLLLILCITLTCCHTDDQTRFGLNLPQNGLEYEQLGNVLLDLDADRNPMRRLRPVVGDWTLLGSYEPWPDAAKIEIRPVARINWILAQRGLECRFWFSSDGQATEDLFIIQWDPVTKAYDLRIRSTGWPVMTTGKGQWNQQNGTLDFTVKTINPDTGKTIRILYRLDQIQPDSHRWQQFRTTTTGELVPFATMMATRAVNESQE